MTTRFNRRRFLSSVGGASVVAVLPHSSIAEADRLSIATSMPILQDIVANVAGEMADVFSIMPANADPHPWEAKPEDMVRVAEAEAFISIGAKLEPFVETGGWRRSVRDNSIPEFIVTDHVELIVVNKIIDHGDHVHDLRGGDPHIWLDPLIIVQAVPAIAEFLTQLQPEHADTFASNAAAYSQLLEDTHPSLEDAFAAIPDDRRKLITFHDALRYFAARYGFDMIDVILEHPDSEVSAKEMADLLTVIEENNIDVVFTEPQFNTSVLDIAQQEGGFQIGVLLTDSFGEGVDTHVGLLEFNRDQLVTYLGE